LPLHDIHIKATLFFQVLDLDAKVRTLTATLVKKQQAVELLTAERNAMRLQLEKAEASLQLL
jgi:hypothetical protein